MNNLEHEQPIDDCEAKITPLDQPEPAISPLSPHRFLKSRFSPRQHTLTLRLSVVLSFIVLVLIILPGSWQSLRNTPFGALSSLIPTPTPMLFPEEDSFYMNVNIPWTKVFLDGHLIYLPRNSDAPLKLARGHHLIEWHAEPFQPQSCIVSVPFALNDTCHFAVGEVGQQLHDPLAEVILLHNSLTTLSANQQAALIETVQKTFEKFPASQPVLPGELYVGPNGYVTATQPLKATLHFQFDPQATGNQPYLIAGESCQQLCIVPLQYLPSQNTVLLITKEWLALAFISSSWDYTTEEGHVIAQDQPIDLGADGNGDNPVVLRIRWDGSRWNVKALIGLDQAPPIGVNRRNTFEPYAPPDKVQLDDNPSCVAARDLFLGTFSDNFQVRFVSGPNPAAGCLAIVTGNLANTPSPSQHPVAYFLEHFGISLAVNDAAHKLQPQLPLADAYERSLARQLAVLSGQTIGPF
jgi:hypothetical protein